MLLKAEKIITDKDRIIGYSEEDIYKMANKELIEKILQLAQEKGLVKTMIVHEWDEEKGITVRITAMIRAYNPDD